MIHVMWNIHKINEFLGPIIFKAGEKGDPNSPWESEAMPKEEASMVEVPCGGDGGSTTDEGREDDVL